MHDAQTPTTHSGPTPLRIGVVPYLNVQPLIWAFGRPELSVASELALGFTVDAAPPRKLAGLLHDGAYDVGIVPVFEYLRHPGYTIVPHGAIATNGRVGSVLLFASTPIESVHTVYLDLSSLTSVNLLRVVLAELGHSPRYVEGLPAALAPGCAKLLIGDPALRESGLHPVAYDLGAMWYEQTGLPFVFAAWLVHPSAARTRLNEFFRRSLEISLANLDRIAEEVAPGSGWEPDFVRRYFRDNLCFSLNAEHLEGWRKYQSLCLKHGLCDRAVPLVFHAM